ncbi:unnamed protein product [Paramecium primaurelia]|uniref:Transmembrane protein n=1 Tax=Paramecium primaurelia TaxID=5886 RepID=A0A8S1LA77_PARPR|nr:unnamed protein product [Paramecium primaurelia]
MLHFNIIIFQHLAQIQSRKNSSIKDSKLNYAYGIQLDKINILVQQKVIFKKLMESLWYLILQIKTVLIVLVIIGLNKFKNVLKQTLNLFWLVIKQICVKNDKLNSLKLRNSHRNTNCLILKSGFIQQLRKCKDRRWSSRGIQFSIAKMYRMYRN